MERVVIRYRLFPVTNASCHSRVRWRSTTAREHYLCSFRPALLLGTPARVTWSRHTWPQHCRTVRKRSHKGTGSAALSVEEEDLSYVRVRCPTSSGDGRSSSKGLEFQGLLRRLPADSADASEGGGAVLYEIREEQEAGEAGTFGVRPVSPRTLRFKICLLERGADASLRYLLGATLARVHPLTNRPSARTWHGAAAPCH